MKKILILTGFLILTLSAIALGDTYLSNDTLRLMVPTYDTSTYPTLANADSVVWWRLNYSGTVQRLGAQTTGDVETGVYSYEIAACSVSSASYAGYYAAYAKVYKSGKTAAKTEWTWKAVPGSGLRLLSTNDSTAMTNWKFLRVDSATAVGRVWDMRNGDTVRVDLANSFGTLAATQFAAAYWHSVAVYADSGTVNANISAIKAKTDQMRFYGTAPNDTAIVSYGINASGTAPTAYENAQAMVHYLFDSTFTTNTFGWYVHTNLDAAVSSRSTFNPATTRVHVYNSDTLLADLTNSIGTLSFQQFDADYWHAIAYNSDSGAAGSNPWSSAQRDSVLEGRWRYSGDSSNVLLAAGDSVPAYLAPGDSLKLALIKAKTDKLRFHSASPNDTDVVAYSTNATGTAPTAYENAQAMVHYLFDSTFTTNTFGWYVHTNLDAAVSSRSTFNPATTRVHTYNTDSLGYVADIRNGDTVRVDFTNSFGALAATMFAAAYWHNVAVYADSGNFPDSVKLNFSSKASQAKISADSLQARYSFSLLLPGLKMLGAVGDSQVYYYNAEGLMDSMRYWNGASLVSRTLYTRTADTLAPRKTNTYSY